ncbi:hypothetical protein DIPPA_32980 [Diplonema papillatum]|nr:hypothetical protein DIPPA_32980 [Diplonema papillatum]|eukprot:gene20206-31067_t
MTQLPPVTWAQRPECILLTVCVQDAEDVQIKTLEKSVEVTCKADKDKKPYHTKLELRGEIIPEESTAAVRPRQIEMKLKKKDDGPYWEGLTEKKQNNVKIDWARWVDEEDATPGAGTGDFGLGDMSGIAGMGMDALDGGLGGVNLQGGGDPEKIQAMLESMGNKESTASGVQEADDDDEDDDMPGLEPKQ